MKAKKLIEVAMPIKEISAESVRDKGIRQGHISTLHLWWARRPLPTCRAVVFASLVPDPLDDNCPKAFKDAIRDLLCSGFASTIYRPYKEIPYTTAEDSMEDNLRNRLLMFIGKFSEICQRNMLAGQNTTPKDQISNGSLIKWESKNDPVIIRTARELIWVAYNSEKYDNQSYEALSKQFDVAYSSILECESALYGITDRHIRTQNVIEHENALFDAISHFQDNMPSVFDPFAGGGAIPLEAARLGCRSFGNDINPVAHIIEKGSVEFPQKYGKPITYSKAKFESIYGEDGVTLLAEKDIPQLSSDFITIPNRLSFDFAYYAKKIIKVTEDEVGDFYPRDINGDKPVAYYWARTAVCSNPSCRAEVPLLSQFYLCKTARKKYYLKPVISGKNIQFEIHSGTAAQVEGWNKRGNVTCPCCGSVTSVEQLKAQSCTTGLKPRLIAIIGDSSNGKTYTLPTAHTRQILSHELHVEKPQDPMTRNSNGGDTFPWGFTKWADLMSYRQVNTLYTFIKNLNEIKKEFVFEEDYCNALKTYLALWIDRIAACNTSMGFWNSARETLERIMGRQAIPMRFEFPESNPFCGSSGGASSQIEWITRFIEEESPSPFSAICFNTASGEIEQFPEKSISAVVTDPPYYDAIAYADLSDFFYIWLKRTLSDTYDRVLATPQTPKNEECTALKHHHDGDYDKAKNHFENKLLDIFKAIEKQTNDVVSIMFAHQSTEAWTTLCDSILGANMNIEGSWTIDTEMQAGFKTNQDYLESSVTVACRPAERKGHARFKSIKSSIHEKVSQEVKTLYELGFRGPDLLTACFGKAVSVFGNYESVEKSDGSEVTVAELLELARASAYTALVRDFAGDDYTKFYIGWLQLNGMNDTDFDDATKFTRVGLNVDISDIFAANILIKDETARKQHLASFRERRIDGVRDVSDERPLIDKVHRAMYLWESSERNALLQYIARYGQDINNEFWRVLVVLKDLLPISSDDYKQVSGLLQNAEALIRSSKDAPKNVQEASLFDNE